MGHIPIDYKLYYTDKQRLVINNHITQKVVTSNKIYTIEDHHQAYFLWKKHNIKKTTLVHIDAHIDYRRSELSLSEENHINIGNYIYPAIRNGIVSSFYWVIPGNIKSFPYNIPAIKQLLLRLQESEKTGPVKYRDGSVSIDLESVTLHICVLDTLPVITKTVLLDIDVDYFINRSLYETYNINNINEKDQWISVSSFYKKLNNKISKIALTTIAYSTNDGWTPMKYKSIGDELVEKIGSKNELLSSQVTANKYLKKFRSLFDQNRISESKKYYLKYSHLHGKDPMTDMNYVFLYLKRNQTDLALKEINKFLGVDPNNRYYLMQLGVIYLKQNKLSQAKKYINKGLGYKPIRNRCLIYLTYIEIIQNNWKNAEKILESLDPGQDDGIYLFLKGLVSLRLHNNTKSENCFRDLIEKPLNFHIPDGMEEIDTYLQEAAN